MMTVDDILSELQARGVRLEEADLPGNMWSSYDLASHTVWLDSEVTERHKPYALLHELLHVRRGDDGHQPGRVERKIDREVAVTLISARDFILASKLHNGHLGGIAQELDSPMWAVEAYVDYMQRRSYR